MSGAIIQAEGSSKLYQRGALASSDLLRDKLAQALRSLGSVFQRKKSEMFWAL